MRKKVFILGASGSVGRELVKQIFNNDYSGDNGSLIIGVANSKNYFFDRGGLCKDFIDDLSNGIESTNRFFSVQGVRYDNLTELVELVKANGFDGEVVFVDVTAGKDELLEMHKYILNNSNNFLVTANKNPISLYSMEEFNLLMKNKEKYETNTTVMGGGGVLDFVDDRYNIGDNIKKIQGVFSGTLGYIMSELEKNELSFSEIVKQAKEGGYTEPNPWDDLNGLDVARKVVILARYMGMNVSIDDVEVEPLIDEKYAEFEGEEFLNVIKDEDERFKTLIEESSKKGEVLRYVGEINNGKISVGLKLVSKDSDLGSLSGTANIAIVESEIMSQPVPHIIKSRGAGLELTAASVRVGINKINIG